MSAPQGPATEQMHGGSADNYFQEGQQDTRYAPQQQYGQQPQQYQNGGQQQYYPPQQQQQQQQQYPPPQQQQFSQQPPTYNQQAPQNNNEKINFNQTFKVDKPKYNDIWAALLFLATFAGFVVVSGISIQGYSATKLFQGGTIYGGASTVGLSTNTIILL